MSEPEPIPGNEPAVPYRGERRVFVRLTSDLAATCRPAGRRHDVSWPGRLKNISRGGVGLLLRHCFRPGTDLAVELRRPTGAFLCSVKVRVVHATAVFVEGNHLWLLGCAFDQPLSEEELQALR
jgi:hypothetical protein